MLRPFLSDRLAEQMLLGGAGLIAVGARASSFGVGFGHVFASLGRSIELAAVAVVDVR